MQGGREIVGILKGFDSLMNIVLDEAVEYMRELDDPYELNGEQRTLGMVICRGTTIMTVNPVEGMTEIQNPYEMCIVYSHKQS
ncbi:uncharacterized protein [Blastocystis hominis]|uniref:Sm domain-containing protein n=1 Tax=Blastocystis hominis TaxID=12968 RepID=D8LXY0_BLAHO|nr:uncharacterized protein [Blastocystis hominis]CBK20435.2 unnamed protein product [Blastocystis hominis]|eukprot:XP_012894483.1 uncharacterized protein [Blastocystis hominis]